MLLSAASSSAAAGAAAPLRRDRPAAFSSLDRRAASAAASTAAAAGRRAAPAPPRAHASSSSAGPSHPPPPPGSTTTSQQPQQPPPLPPNPRIAVFVSGGGSNFRAIHAAALDGRLPPGVAFSAVVSDVPSCAAVSYAREHGIPVLTYPSPKSKAFEGLSPQELADALDPAGGKETAADVVLLAGYLKLVPPAVVRLFPKRMLNIHPALLPAFGGKGLYGERVHRAVIASGARFSGPTVHFVDEEYDTGPILAQRCVPVFPDDSPQRLAKRVLKEEHVVYPEAVAALVEGRVTWRDDGVPVVWTAH